MLLNTPPTVRHATQADWPAIEALLLANKLPTDGAQAHLTTYLLAVSNGEVVGSAGAEVYGQIALLRSVAVAPGLHKQGIVKLLLDRLLLEAQRRDIGRLYLLTFTAPEYIAQFGFKRGKIEDAPEALKASAELQGACPACAAFMSLTLQETLRRNKELPVAVLGASRRSACEACRRAARHCLCRHLVHQHGNGRVPAAPAADERHYPRDCRRGRGPDWARAGGGATARIRFSSATAFAAVQATGRIDASHRRCNPDVDRRPRRSGVRGDARSGQWHLGDRQRHTAAGALRTQGLRSTARDADGPCPARPGIFIAGFRAVPRPVGRRRAVAVRIDRIAGSRCAARDAEALRAIGFLDSAHPSFDHVVTP